jgi:hypothetical protein
MSVKQVDNGLKMHGCPHKVENARIKMKDSERKDQKTIIKMQGSKC